ncbi:phosphotransferase family protein [Pueribacillus theae]|nr:phosphotransferase family protein [Pueribacillus theae]
MALETDDLQAKLSDYIAKHIVKRKEIELTDFSQPSGGWSDETFMFTICWEENNQKKTKDFVVRKVKKDGLMAKNKNLFPQYKMLAMLSENTSLPVPKVYSYEKDESVLNGEFFVMEKLEGKSYVPWSKEGRKFFAEAAKSKNITGEFVRYLVDLHTFDYKSIGFEPSANEPDFITYLDEKIKDLEDRYLAYKFYDDPVITDAMEWLKHNKPNPVPLSIIHNDYRTGNLLYKDDHISGILDWEAAEIGDPRMDLAYVCAKPNRMDSPLVCYLLERDRFLSSYREQSNIDFTDEDIYYYEVYHQFRFLLISLSAAHAFVREMSTDLRMSRQGYRLTLMKNMLAELLGY